MKMRLKEMKVSSQLKGGIYEVSFGYNPNLGGYMTLMSDIPKLSEIRLGSLSIDLKGWNQFMVLWREQS